MENKKKILIFNVNWLGDVLFSTATIRNIRYNFPDSFIACIIPERCYPVLEGNTYLDEIIIYDEKGKHKSLLRKLGFIGYLRKIKFDMVFLLHRSFSRALITTLAGIPERIGYYTRKRGFLLTKKIPPPDIAGLHRIDYYLNVIRKAGLEVRDRFADFFVSDKDLNFVDDFLVKELKDSDAFLIGINPGGNWNPKRWPKEYFAKIADRLIKEFSAKVIITGSSEDLALAEEIRDAMKGEPIIGCGKFNLKQFAVISKVLDLFITADSGPLHIANAVGAKKIIALFGPTDPAVTGPFPDENVIILRKDVGCRIPCYRVDCKNNRCMKAITVDDVMAQIRKI
jgi:lipopolysaccharide heptosyltransferase II